MKLQYFTLALMALALPVVLASAPVGPQYVFQGTNCFSIQQTEKTTLEAPVKDEKPDMDTAILRHVNVTYKPACGRLEIK